VADPLDTSVPSCLFKKADGTIVRNEMGPLLRDLDALPFPDRSLYRRFYADLPYSSLTMVAGRGCPFNCSFCYNRTLKKLFDADLKSGNYVRLRSPARVIEEIEDHVARFGRPDYVKFYDDTFIFHRRWLDEFLDLYIARIRIPFTCLGRADLVDEPLMARLKEAGLSCFLFAVETGNEQLRRRVLKKGISDAQILECGRLLHKYRIPFRVYNMMGIPEETWEDALSTVELNRRIGNPLPLCTIYDPYPDTELAEVAASQGMLSRPLDSGTFSKIQYASSLLRIDPRILRIQMLFFYFVKFPFLDRLLRWWIRRDHKIVNQLLFYPAYAYVFWRSYKHTVREMIQIVLRSARPLVGLEVEPQDRPASSIAPSTPAERA
jgi:radical SAM superfamily enzyme YgiQ (UPF0313 family)